MCFGLKTPLGVDPNKTCVIYNMRCQKKKKNKCKEESYFYHKTPFSKSFFFFLLIYALADMCLKLVVTITIVTTKLALPSSIFKLWWLSTFHPW
jgi:hypothetical protein